MDILVRWGGLYVIITTGWAALSKQLAWSGQLGWPEIIFLALWMGLATVFLIAASLALFRYFRPLPQLEASPVLAPTQAAPPDFAQALERIKRLEERQDGARVVEAVGSTKKSKLTETDRDRCAAALRDMNDFIGMRFRPFHKEFAVATGLGPRGFIDALPALRASQRNLIDEANTLLDQHSHYYDLMQLNAASVLEGLNALSAPFDTAVKAKDWPNEAQAEKAKEAHTKFGHVWNAIMNVWRAIPEKRAEYIDG